MRESHSFRSARVIYPLPSSCPSSSSHKTFHEFHKLSLVDFTISIWVNFGKEGVAHRWVHFLRVPNLSECRLSKRHHFFLIKEAWIVSIVFIPQVFNDGRPFVIAFTSGSLGNLSSGRFVVIDTAIRDLVQVGLLLLIFLAFLVLFLGHWLDILLLHVLLLLLHVSLLLLFFNDLVHEGSLVYTSCSV